MTLEEYLKQEDPSRKPYVLLEPHEYKLGVSYKVRGLDTYTQVFITSPLFHDAFPDLKGEYVMINQWPNLYTVDRDGNPRSISCFRIKKEA